MRGDFRERDDIKLRSLFNAVVQRIAVARLACFQSDTTIYGDESKDEKDLITKIRLIQGCILKQHDLGTGLDHG